MEGANEPTSDLTSATALPPIARGRSFLTCSPSPTDTCAADPEWNKSSEKQNLSNDDRERPVDDQTDDGGDINNDDDTEEIRALASAANSLDEEDESADETDGGNGEGRDQVDGKSSTPGDHLAPLSSSSASVLGRIAAGFNTAVSGGLHPLIRSPRVAPEPPSPSSPSPRDFFWGPVMPGYVPTSDETKTGQSTMVIKQTVQLEQTETSNDGSDGDIGLRQAIPIMPMFLAVVCCLLNVISPGLGKLGQKTVIHVHQV